MRSKGNTAPKTEKTPKRKLKYKKPKEKIFKAISPEGEEYISVNAFEFAGQHDLTLEDIYLCLLGIRKRRKGWSFEYILQTQILSELKS